MVIQQKPQWDRDRQSLGWVKVYGKGHYARQRNRTLVSTLCGLAYWVIPGQVLPDITGVKKCEACQRIQYGEVIE